MCDPSSITTEGGAGEVKAVCGESIGGLECVTPGRVYAGVMNFVGDDEARAKEFLVCVWTFCDLLVCHRDTV